jgi:outer membrane protein, heavy metal efflux system
MAHGAPTGGEQQLTVQLEQVIPIGGQLSARRDVAERLASAAELDFATVYFRLICDVRDAYLSVQVAEARRAIVLQGLADFERIETIVTSRVVAGANAQYDRMRADVERSRWRSRLAESNRDVIDARTRLLGAIGAVPPSASDFASDSVPMGEPPEVRPEMSGAIAMALSQRPEIGAERRRADALVARIGQVKREFTPSPSVSVGYSPWFNVQTSSGREGGGAVMAGVSLPLPLWDHGQGTVQRAQSEALAARARRDASEREIVLQVIQASRTLDVRLAAWHEHRDVAVASAGRMRQMADAAYREGKLGILELVDAYNALLAASETALDLQASAWGAARSLERALGPSR